MSKSNKNGRPSKGETERLKYRVAIKFATADYYTLKAKAKAAGITTTEFARQAVVSGAVLARHTPETIALVRRLCGMDNNLNQLARQAHTQGYPSIWAACLELSQQIGQALKILRR